MTSTIPELEHIRFSVDDEGVATALLDRAGERMNTMGPELATDVEAVVSRVESDDAIKALIIGSAKQDNFLAGADIRWLARLDDAAVALEMLGKAHQVFQRLEDLHRSHGKPVVAAIHGPCLGGGLELAMACGIRIASDDAKATQMGQPEVKLGLIPGAGGTQRLPRLVGIATGLDLMMTGRSVRPKQALKMGLIDEVCPEQSLLEVAHRRAVAAIGRSSTDGGGGPLALLKTWLSPKHLQELALEDNPVGRKVLFKKAHEAMMKETRGNYPAPVSILRAVRVGAEEGIEAGYAAELEEFAKVVVSPEAKALIGLFLDSTALKKDRGIDGDAVPRSIAKVGVLGGGLMGGGIAAVNTTRAGVHSRIKEIDDAGVQRGLAYVKKVVDGQVKRRRIPEREGERLMQLVTGSTDYRGFADVDMVIEAVFEDRELKRSILQDIEGVVREDTIFASNTSSIPIADIAAASSRPETVIGMHYFSPVEKMPLLEIVVTDATADWVTATCVDFGKKQGKTVIVVDDGPGFYTSRILAPYMNEVGHLLKEGVRIEAIEQAMVRWGFPVGPITLMDEVGIDVGAKVTKVMTEAFGDRLTPPEAFGRLLEDDRRGRKNGRGFFHYDDGKKGDVDSSIYDVIGVETSIQLAERTIQDRLGLLLVNEAVRCLEEGILRSARDGDIGAVFGLGFPPFRGGPFSFIDRMGAADVVGRLDNFAKVHGERYAAAELLRKHAEEGVRFRAE